MTNGLQGAKLTEQQLSERAFFVFWLWMTTNNAFFTLTPNPDGSYETSKWPTVEDSPLLISALNAIAPNSPSPLGPNLLGYAQQQIQNSTSARYEVIDPATGQVIQARIPWGSVLAASKELYMKTASYCAIQGSTAYTASDPTCRNSGNIIGILPKAAD